MKKHLLTLGLLFLLLSGASSQTDFRFADSTAQWNILEYNYGWFPMYPDNYFTTFYNADKDTLIQSVPYQAINGAGNTYFLRRDSLNRIYQYSSDTAEYFLYDFGKTTGDTIHNLSHSWLPALSALVDSVDSVYIGHWRKRMFVRVGWEGSFMAGSDIWIDGIGSPSSHLLHPASEQLVADGPDWTLLCYFENAALLYHDDFYDTCDYRSPSSVNEVDNILQFQLSPNPATNQINLQSESNFQSSSAFQLFDITGQMVLQQTLTDKTNQIPLYHLSKGIYLYRLVSPGHQPVSGKLAIE